MSFLRNPGKYQSCSAFSPIVNPSVVPWGIKAFTGYLGDEDKEAWKQYDATELAKTYDGPAAKILIDQGVEDQFLEKELKTENFIAACKENDKLEVEARFQPG